MATKEFGNGVCEVQVRVGRDDLEAQLAWIAQAGAGDGAAQEAKDGVESLLSELAAACDGRQDIHRKTIELEVLEDGRALLFNPGAPSPFIVASGYDPGTKSWASGSYHARLEDAVHDVHPIVLAEHGDGTRLAFEPANRRPFVVLFGKEASAKRAGEMRYETTNLPYAARLADPDALEGTDVVFAREDFRAALRQEGVEPTEANVDEAIEKAFGLRGWKESAIADGNDLVADAAASIAAELGRGRFLDDWGRCPKCGSACIDGGSILVDGSGCAQNLSCGACGAEWVETYRQADRVVLP